MLRLLPTFLSFTTTLLASILLVKKAVVFGFIDLPDSRKVHTLPTPRTGGLAMILGGGLAFLALVAFGSFPWPSLPLPTWFAGFGFIAVGALDDRYAFLPRQKFLVLLALSAIAAWPWVVVFQQASLPWLPASWSHSPLLLPGFSILATLWFMAVPNAVNIEDAINGYMGGFTLLLLGAAYFLGVDTRVAIGSLLGFLLLNWPKARHFMGDAGSFGCGFFLAEALLRAGGLQHPLLALAFTAPISLDVAMGILRRRRLGQHPFQADRATLPHHLLHLLGSATWASPLLWLNALGFIWSHDKPYWLGAQGTLYICLLFFFNRKFLTRTHDRLPTSTN